MPGQDCQSCFLLLSPCQVTPREVLTIAEKRILKLIGHEFGVLDVGRPVSPEAAVNLAKIVSKLSPLVGNLIEFNVVELLNELPELRELGNWSRQDPGFPDAIFTSKVTPAPGLEIKAWFPLATEITARFKDSQLRFSDDEIDVALIAWLPEYVFFGKPRILQACVVSGRSVAQARDLHYHQPPHYLVLEPGDTTKRTKNLQQRTTTGYGWQGTPAELAKAQAEVAAWQAQAYSPATNYQTLLQGLMNRYPYRVETNYAKLDRIGHSQIETFKQQVLNTKLHGLTVRKWADLLKPKNSALLENALRTQLKITDADANQLVE